MSSTTSIRRRPSSARLGFDSLECRRLLSGKPPAQVMIQEIPNTPNPGQTELLITGTKKNDGIVIKDDGTNDPGNISVSLSNGTDFTSVNAINSIEVAAGTGKDNVLYELDGDLEPNLERDVLVGSGAKNGGGTVQFTVNIVGKILARSDLLILGTADQTKTTTMTLNDSGLIDGELTAGILAASNGKSSKAGPERLFFSSTAEIDAAGQLTAGLLGTKKNDTADVEYSGKNNGEIDINEMGNGGSDQLTANIDMSAVSNGTVGESSDKATVSGAGHDLLTFRIRRGTDSTSTTGINATILGSSRKDKLVHTANVISATSGSDTIVS
jgi:hypothetical protein